MGERLVKMSRNQLDIRKIQELLVERDVLVGESGFLPWEWRSVDIVMVDDREVRIPVYLFCKDLIEVSGESFMLVR